MQAILAESSCFKPLFILQTGQHLVAFLQLLHAGMKFFLAGLEFLDAALPICMHFMQLGSEVRASRSNSLQGRFGMAQQRWQGLRKPLASRLQF